MDQGALDRAEPWIKQAGSNSTWARYCLLKSDYKKAEEYYSKVLKATEQNRDANNLFTAYSRTGQVLGRPPKLRKGTGFLHQGDGPGGGDAFSPHAGAAGQLL